MDEEVEPLINLSEITEIELLILKQMRKPPSANTPACFTARGSISSASRDWQASNRFEHIDWPQSSLNDFSPLIVREFEQPTTST